MGCDVHMYAEFADSPNGPWKAAPCHVVYEDDDREFVDELGGGWRNYALFGYMAGVREYDCLFEPRSIPDDVSETVLKAVESWSSDGHTHSWLTLTEFKKCLRKAGYKGWKKASPNISENAAMLKKPLDDWPSYTNIVAYCEKILDDMKAEAILLGQKLRPTCRLIFWFDN